MIQFSSPGAVHEIVKKFDKDFKKFDVQLGNIKPNFIANKGIVSKHLTKAQHVNVTPFTAFNLLSSTTEKHTTTIKKPSEETSTGRIETTTSVLTSSTKSEKDINSNTLDSKKIDSKPEVS